MRTLLEIVNFDLLHPNAILPCGVLEFLAVVLTSRINIHPAYYWSLNVELQFGHYLTQEFIPQLRVIVWNKGIEFYGEDGDPLYFLEFDIVMVGYDAFLGKRGGVLSLSPLRQFHDFPGVLFNINIRHEFSPIQLNLTSSHRHIEMSIIYTCQSILWMPML